MVLAGPETTKKLKKMLSKFRGLCESLHPANYLPSGIPVVKISPESERTKDAIAKARKAVEEDQKDDAAKNVEKTEQDGGKVKPETTEKSEESATAETGSSTSKKREREEDHDTEVSTEAKKSKVEAEV